MHGGDHARLIVRDAVVREARNRGGEHGQDAEADRHVRRAAHVEDVEDDGQREGTDGHVGEGGVQAVAQPFAVQEVGDGFDWPEDRADPAHVEVAEGFRPARLGIEQAGEESTDHDLFLLTIKSTALGPPGIAACLAQDCSGE